MEAALPLGSTKLRDQDLRRWRYNIQIQYQRARAATNERPKIAIQDRADRHNAYLDPASIEVGSQVLNKRRIACQLAHMWHGLFRVEEMCGVCAVWSDIGETPYKLFPLVHISKLKKVKTYLDRPTHMLRVTEADRIGFDEAIQPKDSWKNNLKDNELEVKKIANVRSGQ